MANSESETFVRTFARGLKVIEVMGQNLIRMNLSEISMASELPRTVVRRFLLTLIELGFVKTDSKVYWLTPNVLRLGLAYLYSLPFWREAQMSLDELFSVINQSSAVSVLDGDEIVYIHRVHAKKILAMSPIIGSRLPAYAVSMGRVLLAGLSEQNLANYFQHAALKKFTQKTVIDSKELKRIIIQVRKEGYAWIDGELDESISGLAVPVRDKTGEVVAAINVSLPYGLFTEEVALKKFLPYLLQAASKLKAKT